MGKGLLHGAVVVILRADDDDIFAVALGAEIEGSQVTRNANYEVRYWASHMRYRFPVRSTLKRTEKAELHRRCCFEPLDCWPALYDQMVVVGGMPSSSFNCERWMLSV